MLLDNKSTLKGHVYKTDENYNLIFQSELKINLENDGNVERTTYIIIRILRKENM